MFFTVCVCVLEGKRHIGPVDMRATHHEVNVLLEQP